MIYIDIHCGLLYCVCMCVCVCASARLCQYQCATSDRAYSSTDSSFAIKYCRFFLGLTYICRIVHCENSKSFHVCSQSPLCNTDSNYSTPPKSPLVSGSSGTAQESTDSRPRPPSPPPHTSPVTVGGAKPAAGSYSSPSTTHHSPQPPREDSVKCETTIACVCVCTVCVVCSMYVVCVVCVCVQYVCLLKVCTRKTKSVIHYSL